ncbi:unnamed protein product [Closterium sp. Yama58-4]|nr:unnamed protein product [Closterium sp. Yama58-4]
MPPHPGGRGVHGEKHRRNFREDDHAQIIFCTGMDDRKPPTQHSVPPAVFVSPRRNSVQLPSPEEVLLYRGMGGIGYALAEELARRGARVYASAVKAAEMEGLNVSTGIRTLELDVTIEESIQAAVAHVVAEEGRIDVLVNNAGIGMPCPVADVPLDQLRQVLDVNLYGAVAMARAVFPVMAQQQTRSRILNMASVAAYVNRPWSCAYSASKAALAAATSCMRMEMRPFGIDVVLVTPGYIKSRIFRNALASAPILPSSSLFKPYEACYREQFAGSADNPWATNTADFAARLADVALGKGSPPWRVLYGHQALFAVLMSYLPTTILDFLLWVVFAQKK